LLHGIVDGRFPPGDFSTTHLSSPASPADAVLSFFGHHVIASDVDADWVRQWTDQDPFALSDVRFLAAFADRLGVRPGIYDAVFAARGEGADPSELGLTETSDRYHGLAGRLEAAYEVDESARGQGRGKQLVVAARRISPTGIPVFMQISPGNVWSMRATSADPSWRVVGGEVLFHRSPVGDLLD
jgi:GNAT superfamily N-acetyltransferase